MKLFSIVCVMMSMLPSVDAAVSVIFSGDLDSGTATLTIPNDIVFTMNGTDPGGLLNFHIEDSTPSDSQAPRFITTVGIQYSVNGGALRNFSQIRDNGFAQTIELWDTAAPNFEPGDVLTIHAGSSVAFDRADQILSGTWDWPSSGSYEVGIYSNSGSTMFSSVVSVPEPSSFVLLSLGVSAFLFRRKKV